MFDIQRFLAAKFGVQLDPAELRRAALFVNSEIGEPLVSVGLDLAALDVEEDLARGPHHFDERLIGEKDEDVFAPDWFYEEEDLA